MSCRVCGLPPHTAVRLSQAQPYPKHAPHIFLRLSLRKKLSGPGPERLSLSAVCGGKPQGPPSTLPGHLLVQRVDRRVWPQAARTTFYSSNIKLISFEAGLMNSERFTPRAGSNLGPGNATNWPGPICFTSAGNASINPLSSASCT